MKMYTQKTMGLESFAKRCKQIGRIGFENSEMWLDWSASGLEFNGNFEGDMTLSFSAVPSEESKLKVFLDGEEKYIIINPEDKEKTIFEDIKSGYHEIKIYRASENGPKMQMTVKSITFCGELTASPEEKDLFIEYIGDSISAGCGNIWTFGTPNVFTRDGDGTLAYTVLTAKEFDADWSVLARSGATLCDREEGDVMSTGYKYISHFRNKSEYNFPRKADVFVMELGANDFNTQPPREVFIETAKNLISLAREKNENVKVIIFGVYRQDDENKHSYWQKEFLNVQEQLGGEENGIYYYETPYGMTGWGHHPDVKECAEMAERFIKFMKPIISDIRETKQKSE